MWTIFIAAILLLSSVESAKILGLFPSISKSHHIFGHALCDALAEQGHQITLISPFRLMKIHENIRQIKLDGIYSYLDDYRLNTNMLEKQDESIIEGITNLIYGTAAISNYTLGHPNLQEILRAKNETFDLLLLDSALTDSLLGVAHYYGMPTVVLSVGATNKWTNEMTGNPNNPSYNPNMFLGYSERMTFTERLLNTMMSVFDVLTYNFLYLPSQETIYRRYFANKISNLPPLIDLVHNVNLVLLNSDPVIQYPRSLMSNMVEVAGMHIRPPVDMSPDILEFIEAAKKGVIYLSFGSDVKFADFPEEKVMAFLDVFENMTDYRILMKWERNVLPRQIHRIVIGPWMPQQEILAHPNVRLFITHGGLLSHIESIYYGKPVIGVPLSRDQELNVAQAVQNGFGMRLAYDNITEASVREALAEMLNNTEYRSNAIKLSKLFKTNQVKPIDRALYHIDQVLATKGAPHLRSAAVDLSFWEIQQIDVFLVILLGIILIVAVPSTIILLVLRKTNPYKPQSTPQRRPRKKAVNTDKQVNQQNNHHQIHNNNLNLNNIKKKD